MSPVEAETGDSVRFEVSFSVINRAVQCTLKGVLKCIAERLEVVFKSRNISVMCIVWTIDFNNFKSLKIKLYVTGL